MIETGASAPARPALPLAAHLAALHAAADVVVTRAAQAGLDAPVPTCPGWRVADAVAHLGKVHRWAAANLRGDDARVADETEILGTVPPEALLAWFAAGAEDLALVLTTTRADVAAMVFLEDAPPPRDFWARRQAHESTIHAVDVLSAALGRYPTAAEAALPHDLAVDGVDELLTGFTTFGLVGLCADEPCRIAVLPDDAAPDGLAWLVEVRADGIATERRTAAGLGTPAEAPDAVFRGSAAQLYLGLWNRGEEVRVEGRAELLDRWHARAHVVAG